MCYSLHDSNIIVTGASGMIGSHVVSKLLERNDGINVIAFVRDEDKARKVLAPYIEDEHLKIVVQDMLSPISYSGSVDYIVHAAGVTGGSRQHLEFPLRTIDTAILGTIDVLELAKQKKAKGVVYTSSLEVYGKMPEGVTSITETDGGYIDTMNPRSSYSESKRMCENICTAYAKQYGVRTVVARLTATFGPGVAYSDERVFAEFAKCVIEKRDIVLKSTGETVRDYCDVSDCAEALILLLEKGESMEAYNVATSGTEISIKDMAYKFAKLFPDSGIEVKFDLTVDATKLGYNAVQKAVLASEKLQALGWKPVYTLDETIVRLVEYMSEERQ